MATRFTTTVVARRNLAEQAGTKPRRVREASSDARLNSRRGTAGPAMPHRQTHPLATTALELNPATKMVSGNGQLRRGSEPSRNQMNEVTARQRTH